MNDAIGGAMQPQKGFDAEDPAISSPATMDCTIS
jgi:hypothetical protein